MKDSFEVFLTGENHAENIHLITELIHEEYKHEVLEISEKILNNLAHQYTYEDNKNLVMYLYDDENGVDINYKALSQDSWLQDDFAFVSIYNPSEKLRNEETLPSVAGYLKAQANTPT